MKAILLAAARSVVSIAMLIAAWIPMAQTAWSAPALPVLSDAEQAALAAYGELPAFESLSLSPDGTRLAYVGSVGDQRHVLVKSLADGAKLVDFTAAPGQKFRWLQWADKDHILAMVSMTTAVSLWGANRDEYFGVIATDVATGQAWDVLKFAGGLANNAGRLNMASGRVRARQIGGETWLFLNGLFAQGYDMDSAGQMMKINLVKRTHTILESRDVMRRHEQLLDERGSIVAATNYDRERRLWQIAVGRDGHLQPALNGTADIDIPSLQGISPDGQEAWLLSWEGGVARPQSLTLADGKLSATDKADARLRRAFWSDLLIDQRNDHVMAGVVQDLQGARYEFLDPLTDRQWQLLLKALGDTRPAYICGSEGNRRVIVQVWSSVGPRYLLVDMADTRITTLGPQYRQLPSVAEVRAMEYAAGDGLKIPAYLTLPAGREPKGLPLVMLPHGGPEARDYDGFDWWAQALAHQGYAVMQPNFRGSSISNEFVAAGHGEWGRKMQTDLSDGVRYLASQGIVDPARVCIVGASYGGYAALAGVSMQHDIYRCAVSVAGVSDLHRLIKPGAGFRSEESMAVRYMDRWLGVKDIDDPSVDERSPLRHVDAIHVPLLLIHGRDDMVVPYQQSRLLADALDKLHKPYRFVELKAEDHWLSHSATRLQMLTEVAAFLKLNNPAPSAQ